MSDKYCFCFLLNLPREIKFNKAMSREVQDQYSYFFVLLKNNKRSVETKFYGHRVNINEIIKLKKGTLSVLGSIYICLVNFYFHM